jgi:aminopeptidase N
MIGRFLLTGLILTVSTAVSAQDWKSVLGGVVNKVEKTVSKVNESVSMVGTWKYTAPDCKFESDDLLSKAGGEVAAKKVEEQMSNYLSKLGFNENTVYVFNADSTYTSTVAGRTVNGTYSYNKDTKEVTLKTKIGLKMTAQISTSVLNGGKMSLLFKADKLMSLAQAVTGAVAGKSSNATVSTLNTVLSQYNGLLLGFEMQKQ